MGLHIWPNATPIRPFRILNANCPLITWGLAPFWILKSKTNCIQLRGGPLLIFLCRGLARRSRLLSSRSVTPGLGAHLEDWFTEAPPPCPDQKDSNLPASTSTPTLLRECLHLRPVQGVPLPKGAPPPPPPIGAAPVATSSLSFIPVATSSLSFMAAMSEKKRASLDLHLHHPLWRQH